jgi:prolyl-tRNA editing enzyme YbaK/EbsC (Cys-tRNA(Pro) deacylase)
MGALWSALADRTRPAPTFAAFLAESGVACEIVVAHGPDHTTAEAASTLGLPDDSRVLKSLVFMVGGSALLVIARGCDRISLSLLEHHCGAAPGTARLGTPAEAAATTGFAPGCIPPLLMPGTPRVPVLMDEQVLRSQAPVYAGAGAHGDHLSIAPHELRRALALSLSPSPKPKPKP